MAHEASLTKPKLPDDKPGAYRWTSAIAVTTAVMAALASIASVFSGHHTDAAMIEQVRATDTWGMYQGKSIKAAVLESKMELLPALNKEPSEADRANAARYEKEKAEVRATAEGHQKAADDHRRRHTIMAIAVSAFQVAIALCAIALLTKKTWFWVFSMGVAACGIGVVVYGVVSP